MPKAKKKNKNSKDECIACCFQGGGALGAYQAGVLKALQEANYDPDWFVGTSIGAINAAIAAGNPFEQRLEKIEEFWKTIATPVVIDESILPNDCYSRRIQHMVSANSALMFGQPGFFTPRLLSPSLSGADNPKQLSFYDTSPLRSTLEKLIDFDRINDGTSRLSVGAVEVCTGEIAYFDSQKQIIGPEHIMASGALPPGFPAIEIDGDLFWDGGISSNSPVTYVLADNSPKKSLLCFLVHLFDSYGLMPASIDDVMKRRKDIELSSRFARILEMHQEIHALRYYLHQMAEMLPKSKKSTEIAQKCLDTDWDKSVSLVRFIYEGDEDDLASKDYEFSNKSIVEHIEQGYHDGKKGIKKSPWLQPVPKDIGIALYDMSPFDHIRKIQE